MQRKEVSQKYWENKGSVYVVVAGERDLGSRDLLVNYSGDFKLKRAFCFLEWSLTKRMKERNVG